MRSMLLEVLALASLTGFASAGPSLEIRAKRDDGLADLRRMGKLNEDLKFLSGLKRRVDAPQIPAGKRSDIDLLQTEFVSAKPLETTVTYLTTGRPKVESGTPANVVANTLVQDFVKSRSLDSQDDRLPGINFINTPVTSLNDAKKVPASTGTTIVIPIVNEQDILRSTDSTKPSGPTSQRPYIESTSINTSPDSVQVQDSSKSEILTGSMATPSSGAVNNLARSTEPIGSRTKPLDAGPTTNPNALNSIVHEQDEAQLKSQEGQSDHSAARVVDFAYSVQSKVNHSVVPLPNDNSSSLLLKNVYNSSVEAHKVSQLVLKNKTTISVLNTTYACPQNSTNCTQKAKKLVPLVTGETVKLSNATSNKTLEGANGGVIDFFKRYFTW